MPPSPTSPARIFISHASEEAAAANALCEALEQHGQPCWIAPRDVRGGVPYAREITGAIDGARAVLLLLTRASCASEYVLREVDRAAARSVPVVTLRLEEIPPSDELAFYVGKDQWVDAMSPPVVTHVERVLRAVEQACAARDRGRAPSAEGWVPPRERVLKELSEDVRRYLDLTFKLKASLEEATAVLAANGPATKTLLDATLAYNDFAPKLVDRMARYRASVRKYWGEGWLTDFDHLHHVVEQEIYRGALFRLNPVRARLNSLFGAGAEDTAACAALDREKAPLLADLQGRLDRLTESARGFLGALERNG